MPSAAPPPIPQAMPGKVVVTWYPASAAKGTPDRITLEPYHTADALSLPMSDLPPQAKRELMDYFLSVAAQGMVEKVALFGHLLELALSNAFLPDGSPVKGADGGSLLTEEFLALYAALGQAAAQAQGEHEAAPEEPTDGG